MLKNMYKKVIVLGDQFKTSEDNFEKYCSWVVRKFVFTGESFVKYFACVGQQAKSWIKGLK